MELASQFRKQPDVAGGYHVGAMNAFVAGLHLEAQQRMDDFGRAFSSQKTDGPCLLRQDLLAVQIGEIGQINGSLQDLPMRDFRISRSRDA